MRKSALSKWALAVGCVVAVPFGAAACSPGPNESEDVASGHLSLPLITVVNGHKYRLANAAISVTGPTYAWLQTTDDPAETRLSASLLAGNGYSASLFQGSLERDDGSGTFFPVRSELISESTVFFDIFAGVTTSIAYRFRTDGDVVVIGSGDLRVTIAVDEVPTACTPFGADCPAESWCPPSALTGRSLSCISAGTVALGASCNRPMECVAGASCFDLGAGAVCTALCPATSIGQPCASGGTCQTASNGYGLCRP